MMDGPRSPVTVTGTAKKTMSRSFLIDSLIGGAKRPTAATTLANATAAAAAGPYHHPQLDDYIQLLNRTAAMAAAAAAYGYQTPAAATATACPRFFGYPTGKDNTGAAIAADHHHHHHHHTAAAAAAVAVQQHHRRTAPVRAENADAGHRTDSGGRHRQQQHRAGNPVKKRAADEMSDPGKCVVRRV